MNSAVCVDASFALKLVLPEEDSEAVAQKWAVWAAKNVCVVAPYLFFYEVASVLRNKVWRRKLTPEQGKQAIDIILAQDVKPWHTPEIHQKAWELAEKLELPTAYDAFYAAVAALTGYEFWTGDRRLRARLSAQGFKLGKLSGF